MFTAFRQSELVTRLFGWLFGVRSPSEPTPTRTHEPFQLPMLFAVRSPPVPERTVPAIAPFPVTRSYAWSFAARLKSVAGENVPKARKGHRARMAAPAGKAVPKKRPHVLKVCKPSSGVPATAPWRQADVRSSSRAANVVALVDRSHRMIGRGLVLERLAA